jgi:glucose/mannose-6-phosphate isomerase
MITHESSLENFTEQFDYVLDHYTSLGLNADDFSNIIMGGLGGSGIGALISKTYFYDKCPIPIETVADYHLPKFANEKSLVVLNSYSGNTEETLSLFDEAIRLNCKVVVITSGGLLKTKADENNVIAFPLKEGYQPRMTIGLGLTYLCLILGELIGEDLRPTFIEIKEGFNNNIEKQKDSGYQIYDFFKNSLKNKFVIVADRQFAPVATRFTQQLNENSKLEGFVNVLPESNHNVIESYTDRLHTNFIMLYSEENPRVESRFDFLISHLELENNKVLPVQIPAYTLYSIFDVIYRLDWVSVLIANELGSNLMDVPIITNLKEFLTQLDEMEGQFDEIEE